MTTEERRAEFYYESMKFEEQTQLRNGSLRLKQVSPEFKSSTQVVCTGNLDSLEMAAADTITQLANARLPKCTDLFTTCLKYEDLEHLNTKAAAMLTLQSLVAEMLTTLNNTMERHHKELHSLKEMFNAMRGGQDPTLNLLTTLGELIERLERGTMDTGVFANTIDEECGINRLHKFCFEGFIQSARAFEQQVEILIKHSLHFSEQVKLLFNVENAFFGL